VRYLLDTDHISFLEEGSGLEYAALTARMAQHSPADFALSLVSFHEQVLGAHTFISRARTTANVIQGYSFLGVILQTFQTALILPFDTGAATMFDALRTQRIRVATMDLRIGAIALSRGLVVLTRNTVDFSKVSGLVTEDWTV